MKTKSARNVWEEGLTEEHVILQITEGLAYSGFKVFRIVERIPKRGWRGQIIGKFSTPGMPDLLVRKRALQFWIEVKRPGGKRRWAQERWIEEANADGVHAFFADGWDAVVKEIQKRGFL